MKNDRNLAGALLGLFAFASQAGAQTVFVSAAGTNTGRLAVLSTSGAAPWTPPWAESIELLAFDSSARTPLDDLAPARPRLRRDVSGATRLELPGGRGSLFHHRRALADGTSVYGWFVVDPAGVPHLQIELPPPAETPIDPFLERVAAARDGSLVLVATRLEAGGDVYELPLDGGAPRSRSAGIGLLDVLPNGLGCGDGFALAVCRDRVLRWTPGVAGDAQVVESPEPAGWFGDGLAFSANGRFATFVGAASGPEQSRPFVVGANGPALPAGSTTTRYSGSGAAPETLDGPWLAVSDEGDRAAWRAHSSGTYRSELFVAQAVAQPAPAEQVTRTEIFEPYLDEVAVFAFLPGGRLLFAAGDGSDATGAGIQLADVFLFDPVAGAAATVNLTHSSGDLAPPFLQLPTLSPTRILWAPEAQSYLVDLPATAQQHGRLLRVGASGVEVLQDDAGALPFAERAGGDIVLATSDEHFDEHDFRRWPASLLGDDHDVAEAVDERALDCVVGPGGRAALLTEQGGVESLWRVTLASGSAVRLRSWSGGFGPAVSFQPDGTLVASLDVGAGSVVAAWPPTSRMLRLLSSPTRASVLPGGAR